jgi:exopolyphosphatase/guanosine-5'-triphosphate,3'-diphosphate pyrophosphatase
MSRYAAFDIGSNSVRMMAAEIDPRGGFDVLAADRQVTRLGAGVFRDGSIEPAAIDSLCEILARMNERVRPLGVLATRAVATAAVRDASNGDQFIERVSAALGQGVELISGQEEARLIQLGVAARWPHPNERVLIVDIGGGSAELIETVNDRPQAAWSRPLGAVRLQGAFLATDPPTPDELLRLDEFIKEKLAVVHSRLNPGGFVRAIGTSATASALVCAANRIPRARREEADRRSATATQIRRLYRRLAGLNVDARRAVAGIGPRRAEIIVAGAAVLSAVLDQFEIPRLAYCAAGVRDGVLVDLARRGAGAERARLDPPQHQSIERFARRFGVDLRHARHVAAMAADLFRALIPWHGLEPERGRLLEAACYLRDVGHAVNDMSHHKHSHYIVANADLAGFTDAERAEIALLCRYHRKAPPSLRHAEFTALDEPARRRVALLAPLIRIADALDRGRDQRVAAIRCRLRDSELELALESDVDSSLERWAVERVAEQFLAVYQKAMVVVS